MSDKPDTFGSNARREASDKKYLKILKTPPMSPFKNGIYNLRAVVGPDLPAPTAEKKLERKLRRKAAHKKSQARRRKGARAQTKGGHTRRRAR